MKITVNVTQEDIDLSRSEDSRSTSDSACVRCPIAKAVKRIKPRSVVAVGYSKIYIDYRVLVATPSYTGIIQQFCHLRYKPTTFDITDELEA